MGIAAVAVQKLGSTVVNNRRVRKKIVVKQLVIYSHHVTENFRRSSQVQLRKHKWHVMTFCAAVTVGGKMQ